jgi:hypothetical protein
MSYKITREKVINSEIGQIPSPLAEKKSDEEQHVETSGLNLEYNDDKEEPKIHART